MKNYRVESDLPVNFGSREVREHCKNILRNDYHGTFLLINTNGWGVSFKGRITKSIFSAEANGTKMGHNEFTLKFQCTCDPEVIYNPELLSQEFIKGSFPLPDIPLYKKHKNKKTRKLVIDGEIRK